MPAFVTHTAGALSLMGALCACGSSTAGPGPVNSATLDTRRSHAMAYDDARRVTVLFGGFGVEDGTAAADRASTWTWNGTEWTRVATTGPGARNRASMVYDAARQRIVLYGGQRGTFPNETTLGDTWEWNGSAWTRGADGGPPVRAHQHLAYDRTRRRVVLYGGFDVTAQQELHDIWEWDGSSWTKQNASGATSSIAAGIVYDERTNSMLLLSLDPATNRITTDAWNGTALTRSAIASPSCAPLGDPFESLGSRGPVWVGYCASSSASIHLSLNGTSWTSLAGALPSPRGSSALAYDRDRDRLVLFGGETLPAGSPLLGDTWEFDGGAWTRKR